MNNVIRTIMDHRSIRKYKSTPITEEQLHEIVKAGQMASTSSNVQAYSIIRITDSDLRHEIAELAGQQWHIDQAPEFLVWCADLRRLELATDPLLKGNTDNLQLTENFIVATVDTALAAQNCAISAESLGLGILYVGGIRNKINEIAELLKLPAYVYPIFGMCIGYPDEEPLIRPRLSLSAVLHQNTYDEQQLTEAIANYDEQITEYVKQRSQGRSAFSWSEAMSKRLSASRQRTEIKDFLQGKGFMKK